MPIAAPDIPARLTLEGRVFVPVTETTILHDQWMRRHLRAAGLVLLPGEAGGSARMRVALEQVFESGQLPALLAGSLVEEGATWTRETAEQHSAFFSGLTDPAAKTAVLDHAVAFLVDFFVAGAASWLASPMSSSPSPTTRRRDSQPAVAPDALDAPRAFPPIAGRSDSASGLTSSST